MMMMMMMMIRIRQLEIVYSTAQVVGKQVRCGGRKWYMDWPNRHV